MHRTMYWILIVLGALPVHVTSLDNGLALTPPMGWLTWERFRCNTDCVNDPDNCISEKLIMQMADAMASQGYKDAGYEYVIIDDCWLARQRDAKGNLQPDPERFPHGIKYLADYVHSKGLKFGIYEDFGSETCGGFPGSEFHMKQDAYTFAAWGIDYLKFDGCFSDVRDMPIGYAAMGHFLNKTGRPIVYSCEWPLYQAFKGIKPDYAAIKETCNLWRNYGDIQDSWASMIGTVNYYGQDVDNFTQYAGPGGWNDPDMASDYSLSYVEERVQMAMWCIMASPLIMSNDLRNIRNVSKALLQNRNLIRINQDPLGKQGAMITKNGQISIWTKPLSTGGIVVACLNQGDDGRPRKIKFTLNEIGLTKQNGYNISDAFTMRYMTVAKPNSNIVMAIDPHGVQMILAMPLRKRK
ncbi:hypothetical protein FSP39_025412 [Pinctada imbricata]|uniref:Alpha-galactosidase n=1 Tax=Pinctada imbricata TaxID=66713 RepID=A0AA88Y9C6_PINIB|nr:hypothetical protein FSP39_025412 [Pinctada imbricata]